MNTTNGKRKRSINWDEEEKALLRTILKDFAPVIENKCLKSNTNKSKINAWNKVLNRFNELNCRTRDLLQLQAQWKAMKMSARSTMSSFQRETFKTGGGPKPPSPSNEVITVIDLLNPGELTVDSNEFDSDGTHVSHVKDENQIIKVDIDFKNDENHPVTDCSNIIIEDINLCKETQSTEPESIQFCEPETAITKTPRIPSVKPKILQMHNQTAKRQRLSKSDRMDYASDYAREAITHSKKIKDAEYQRRQNMEEEEHTIKIAILKEQLKRAEIQTRAAELEARTAEFQAKTAELQMRTAENK